MPYAQPKTCLLALAITLSIACHPQGLRDLQSIERTVSYVGFKGSPQHEWLNEATPANWTPCACRASTPSAPWPWRYWSMPRS